MISAPFPPTTFRGRVTLLRGNPMMMRVFGGGMIALVLLMVVIAVLPEESRKTVAGLLIAVFVAAYVALLSRGLQPLRQEVELHADPHGLFADGQPLVARADIVQAYLRPAIVATAVKGVEVPAWPMTVELVTTTGQLNIDGGGEPQTQAILAAIGFPLTMVPATHIAQTPQNARNRRLGWIVALILVVGTASAVAAMAYFEQQR
ncbi:MAG: hypothetical protein ABI175_00595 [Polyangiales bacterium]